MSEKETGATADKVVKPARKKKGKPDKKVKVKPEKQVKVKPEKQVKVKPEKQVKVKPEKKAKPEKPPKARPAKKLDVVALAKWSKRLLIPAVIFLCALFIGLFLLVSSIAQQPAVAEGVWVTDTDLSGTDPGMLAALLPTLVPQPDANDVVTLRTDGWEIQRTFGELKLRVDYDTLEQRVLAPGHEGGLLRRISDRVHFRRSPQVIPIPILFETAETDALLQLVHETLHRPATGATLELQPRKVMLHSGMDGVGVDIPLLASRLLAVLETRESGSLRIPKNIVRPPSLKLEPLLEAILRTPQDAAITQNPDGTASLTPSLPGRDISPEVLSTEIALLERRTDRRVASRELPVIITEPTVTETDLAEEIEEAGLSASTGMIVGASFETEIPLQSALDNARARNIVLAANAIDGLVLAPGALFSFNDTTGPRTIEKGYVAAPAYAEGSVILDIGGGICQVSTTLFNALLEAGLELEERHSHMFTVFYAAPGRDAAVSYGIQDLVIRNPYTEAVQLRVSVQAEHLRAEILIPETVQTPLVSLYTRVLAIHPAKGAVPENPAWSPLATTDRDIGLHGAVVETWRQRSHGGNLFSEEKLYTSRYAPFPAEVPTEHQQAVEETL